MRAETRHGARGTGHGNSSQCAESVGRQHACEAASNIRARPVSHAPCPVPRFKSLLRGLAIAVFLAITAAPAVAIDPMEFKDRAEEVRFQELLRELRCLQCQNQTLADSDADIARQLRVEVHRMMEEGKTNDEIKNFLTDRYGEFVLYRPRVETGTWLLWFGPFVILAGGALALVIHLRKRRGNAAAPLATTARDEEDW